MPLPTQFELEQLRAKLACPCGCGKNQTSDEFVMALYLAQMAAQKEFIITSGYRCPKRNENTPGHAHDSPALYGAHADIAYQHVTDAFRILKALIDAGFERIRVYDLEQALKLGRTMAHIHVDRHPYHPYPSVSVGSYATK